MRYVFIYPYNRTYKAILPLLNEYGSVENIYEVIENTPEEELKVFFKESLGINRSPIANLTQESETELVGKKAAYLSKELATIKTDLEAFNHLPLNDLKLTFDLGAALNVFRELEFKSLIEKLQKNED